PPQPAAAPLGDPLASLERDFARGQAFGELQLKSHRDAATTALVGLAAVIVIGLFALLADVNRRILSPCVAASRALAELVAGGTPPRLSEASGDQGGELA